MSDDAADVRDADAGSGESALPAGYELRETTPSVAAFRRLRREAGMTDRSRPAAERGLPNTTYGVHVVEAESGSAVGMARLVGDGGSVFHLSDTAVAPPHQGRGIGTATVDALVAWLRANAPDGACVNLLADVDGFYERGVRADRARVGGDGRPDRGAVAGRGAAARSRPRRESYAVGD